MSTFPLLAQDLESLSPSRPTPTIRLLAVGDMMLGRGIGERLEADGAALAFPSLQSTLDSADLLVGNLECVVSPLGKPQPKAYRFRAPARAAETLSRMGVGVVSLANNHAMDFGYEALADMRLRLSGQGIASVGAGENEAAAHGPAIVERSGMRLAFLAYVDVPAEARTLFAARTWQAGASRPGIAWADPERIAADVAAAKSRAEAVIVFLHFGMEGQSRITKAQRIEAETAIDAGAVLVLGSHPHLLQSAERYRGGLIAYSLGNFIFDGFGFPENYSAILSAELTPSGVGSYDWIPVVIEKGLPRMATSDEAAVIRSELK